MPVARHLRNAPIREALIDIAVKLPQETSVASLRTLRDQVAADYPQQAELGESELELVFSHQQNRFTQTRTPLGYRCQTKDDTKIVQFRVNGFTYNWLRPYETWEALRDSARKLWDVYRTVATPSLVSRVGLRYINVLELPPMKDFAEYLTATPKIPAELPQNVTRFLSRVSIISETSALSAVITEAFEGLMGPKNVTVLFDIDIQAVRFCGRRNYLDSVGRVAQL